MYNIATLSVAKESNVEERLINVDKDSIKLDKDIDTSSNHLQVMNQATPIASFSDSLNDYSIKFHESVANKQALDTICPGTIFPGDLVEPLPSQPNTGTTLMEDRGQDQLPMTISASDIESSHEPALNAFLVNEDHGMLASATLHDIKAEEQVHKCHRILIMLGSFIVASIITVAVAVPVLLTRPGTPSATVSPSSSPVPSETPSLIPSSSPSTGFFAFLSANSFDDSSALAALGSSQQKALDWLVEVSGISDLDYKLLQAYALVTFYYETHGDEWISTVDFDSKRNSLVLSMMNESELLLTGEWLNVTPSINPLGVCSWQGVLCNDKQEINSLTLPGNSLYGSIPDELAILHPSLSKFICMVLKSTWSKC
jgi:hypothetical protein